MKLTLKIIAIRQSSGIVWQKTQWLSIAPFQPDSFD
jgi:hypothetical protein